MRLDERAARATTRHLIELGGLVVKAGLVELTGDDRAVLLGAFLEIADTLASNHFAQSPGAKMPEESSLTIGL
jgi:hypothetical protein